MCTVDFYILSAEAPWRGVVEFITNIAVLISIFMTLIQIALTDLVLAPGIKVLDYCIMVIFIVDFCINLMTEYKDEETF